ncbi:hypothetical protein D3C78_1707900 [compost metagenome]
MQRVGQLVNFLQAFRCQFLCQCFFESLVVFGEIGNGLGQRARWNAVNRCGAVVGEGAGGDGRGECQGGSLDERFHGRSLW